MGSGIKLKRAIVFCVVLCTVSIISSQSWLYLGTRNGKLRKVSFFDYNQLSPSSPDIHKLLTTNADSSRTTPVQAKAINLDTSNGKEDRATNFKGPIKNKLLVTGYTGLCESIMLEPFHQEVQMCGTKVTSQDQIMCYANKYSNRMARCAYENLALRISEMKEVIPNDVKWKNPQGPVLHLLQAESTLGSECRSPSTDHLCKKAENDSYSMRITEHLSWSPRLSTSACDTWINKTAFLHTSNGIHMYFRILGLYNIHQALLDYGITEEEQHQVIRIGHLRNDYRFPEFDKALFPGSLTLDDFPDNATVCFRRVVLVPRSYESILFRCKMDRHLRQKCFECRKNPSIAIHSPFLTFRRRVLKGCDISDSKAALDKTLVFISRRPYKRRPTDKPVKFQRILENENELIVEIRQSFPNVTVKVVHMENLSACEQVKLTVEADVVLGVHGAGLVHFWWLRDEAIGIELEPVHEIGNPSFRMLASLTGRKYVKEKVYTVNHTNVTANISKVLKKLREFLT